MKANIRAFIRKHVNYANNQGIRPAIFAASAEAYQYTKAIMLHRYYRKKEDLIWNADWNICLVLDATRFDLFQQAVDDYSWLSASHYKKTPAWSAGSASPEWYAKTFNPAVMPNEQIGVVSANPFAAKPADRIKPLEHTPLHSNPGVDKVDYVFQEEWGCEVENGYLDVTHPSAVTDRSYIANKDWNVDKLVVHYLQPHIPFRSRPEWFGYRENIQHFGEEEMMQKTIEPYKQPGEVWKQLRDGYKDYDEVWEAYLDNLYWVLDEVDRLRQAIDGKILITSDHGNALGESGLWSHPPNKQIPALREVPWVIIDGLGPAELEEVEYTSYSVNDRPIDDQLKALGYME